MGIGAPGKTTIRDASIPDSLYLDPFHGIVALIGLRIQHVRSSWIAPVVVKSSCVARGEINADVIKANIRMVLDDLKACLPRTRIKVLEIHRDVFIGPILLMIVKGHIVQTEF
jgi:hypothetical protein